MGAVLLIFCAALIFIRAELVLRGVAAFRPDSVMHWISGFQPVISRKLFFLMHLFAGLRTDFEKYNGALPRVFLIVSNHQTLADIPAMAATFPRNGLRYVAKKSLSRGIPYASTSLRWGQHALISRTGDYRAGNKELRRFARLTEQGICPVVFPEGTRSRSGRVNEFYTGAVRIILEQTPIPVLSVALDGGYRLSTLRQLLQNLRGAHYRVKPLTLYPAPKGKREISELLVTIRTEIEEQVREWRETEARVYRAQGKKKPIQVRVPADG
jgi:1-acyl-sn-glycerol-3-phosphate acyltransferase